MTELLLVEDDEQIRASMVGALRLEGYDVAEAADGESGLVAFASQQPDLVVLDLRLPDQSGFDVCRQIRAQSNVPIIFVTAQDDSHDLVAGLEAGADDYVVKPVEPKALAARIRALLRRAAMHDRPDTGATFERGRIQLRKSEGVAVRDGLDVGLTVTEFRLLCELASHPGAVLSREQLLERVWGYDYFGDSRIVDAHVRRLRVKIEDEPDQPTMIVTVRGLGYKLAGE